MNPEMVRHAFNKLLPVWQFADLAEANRLEGSRGSLGSSGTVPTIAQRLHSAWTSIPEFVSADESIRNALPLRVVSSAEVLSFIRKIEQTAIEEHLAPIIVYWSRQTAARLLPGGARYRELLRDAECVSIFSEQRNEPPDEWCILIESSRLSLVLHGIQGDAEDTPPAFSNGLEPPEPSRVPRRPHPSAGDADIALKEPDREN